MYEVIGLLANAVAIAVMISGTILIVLSLAGVL